jgi:hypothetical protein
LIDGDHFALPSEHPHHCNHIKYWHKFSKGTVKRKKNNRKNYSCTIN